MIGLTSTPPTRACARCATELSELALACPSCSALVHRERLEDLAGRAAAAEAANDIAGARDLWLEARGLVPLHSEQNTLINARLQALSDDTAKPAAQNEGGSSWRAKAGAAAVGIGVLLIGKLKFLLLGLTKLKTLLSMFGFIGVYWSIHG